jgi:hypothetical protein
VRSSRSTSKSCHYSGLESRSTLTPILLPVISCGGDESDPLIDYEFNEIKGAIDLERSAIEGSSWKSLFTNRGNLRRLRVIVAIAFFSQWSGNGIASYYLHTVLNGIGITSASTQNLINGILQIWNLSELRRYLRDVVTDIDSSASSPQSLLMVVLSSVIESVEGHCSVSFHRWSSFSTG